MEPIYEHEDEASLELPAEPMRLNMGPAHPATHGTIKIKLELDGEVIRNLDIIPGYLHRGFEKSCERGTWTQVFPYVDRLNYVSPMLNNVGFALAVEKLIGIEVPERCKIYRVILGELARVSDHLTCNAATSMELGAFTPFLWFMKVRDWVYDILEQETGARITHTFGRIGGMAKPPTPGLKQAVRDIIPQVDKVLGEVHATLVRNRIFIDRLQGVGTITPERALSLGVTGPMLRAAGVDYDVRKATPYSGYETYDFEIPIGHDGDTYDRFMVRMEEVRQSCRILEQAIERLPDEGPINVDDPRIILPEKDEVYTTIEATIAHFKIVMEGVKPPKGAVYSYTEGGNGELGFYIVSDGSGTPYRVRCRPPCFLNLKSAEDMIRGNMISDVVPIFGSVNMIGGECDR
jgi:NADH-quinone oxidoreductase subunit D